MALEDLDVSNLSTTNRHSLLQQDLCVKIASLAKYTEAVKSQTTILAGYNVESSEKLAKLGEESYFTHLMNLRALKGRICGHMRKQKGKLENLEKGYWAQSMGVFCVYCD